MILITLAISLLYNVCILNLEIVWVQLYPLKGLIYFGLHRVCWCIFLRHLFPILFITISIAATASTTYFVLNSITGGMITIIHPSIVQGSSFISNMICQYLILPGPLRETFDFVIGEEIDTNYLILHKGILGDDIPGFAGETQIGKCVRLIKLVCSPEAWFCRQLVYFMLSLVPLFGPVVIVLLKASRSGFMKHKRYFELKGLTLAQKNYLWCHKRHLYFSFGFWCTVSEMIPLLNIIFFYTNIIGAAMWAIDIEKLMNSNKESTEPDERAQSAPTTEYRTAEKSNRM